MSVTELSQAVMANRVDRPEFEREPIDARGVGDVQRPLSITERLANNDGARKLAIVVVLALIWEIYARWLGNPLLFPTATDTFTTFWEDIRTGVLPERMLTSIQVLVMGYAAGILRSPIAPRP